MAQNVQLTERKMVRLTSDEARLIEEWAQQEGRSESNVIRRRLFLEPEGTIRAHKVENVQKDETLLGSVAASGEAASTRTPARPE